MLEALEESLTNEDEVTDHVPDPAPTFMFTHVEGDLDQEVAHDDAPQLCAATQVTKEV